MDKKTAEQFIALMEEQWRYECEVHKEARHWLVRYFRDGDRFVGRIRVARSPEEVLQIAKSVDLTGLHHGLDYSEEERRYPPKVRRDVHHIHGLLYYSRIVKEIDENYWSREKAKLAKAAEFVRQADPLHKDSTYYKEIPGDWITVTEELLCLEELLPGKVDMLGFCDKGFGVNLSCDELDGTAVQRDLAMEKRIQSLLKEHHFGHVWVIARVPDGDGAATDVPGVEFVGGPVDDSAIAFADCRIGWDRIYQPRKS